MTKSVTITIATADFEILRTNGYALCFAKKVNGVFTVVWQSTMDYFENNIFSCVPIRLTQTPARCRVRPRARIKVGIGRRLNAARDAEQRAERVERVETPVEAERELIEVGLQMLGAHAVVDAVEPSIHIGEDEVDHRHELFGN